MTGLRALYYRYLYELGALPRKPSRSSYAVRQDAYKLDQRIRLMEFLSKNNINTLAQLETHRQALQTEIRQLLTKRMYATPSLPRKGLMSVLTTAAMSGRDLTSCLPSMREPLSGRWRRKASAPRKASSTAG